MINWLIHRLALIFIALAASGVPAQTAPVAPPAPAEAFFKPRQVLEARLSPSGSRLAVTTSLGGQRVGLIVFDLDKPGQVTQAARFVDVDIQHFEWVNDERLVFDLIDLTVGSGDRDYAPGLFSVRFDGTELRQLVMRQQPFVVSGSATRQRPLDWNHWLLHVPEGAGDEVIIGAVQGHGSDLVSINPMRLNVVNGRTRSMSLGAPPNIRRWIFDAAGQARVAVAQSGGRQAVHWRGPGREEWQLLAEFDTLQAPYTPRFVDAAGTLYVTRSEGPQGTQVLAKFDFATGRPEPQAMVRTPGFDFRGSLLGDRAGAKAMGVRVETDAESTVWFDEDMKRVQMLADGRMPGHVNRLSCRRCGQPDRVVLVQAWSDTDPGHLWLYRGATEQWQLISRVQPAIDPAAMASVAFERIKARDGRDLPLWLTVPKGRKAGDGGPAVVLVHGGPWVRGGHWAWSETEQFLASRGYLVISPEFRGSTGYGSVHFRAGWKQWGRAMQDDVADAWLWAKAKGWADRACIAGASYGGYSTLMGLVRNPELYRCGVAWVALTDPFLYLKGSWWTRDDISDEGRRYSLPAMVGDAEKDAEMLTAASPLAQAARIKAPLLLAFGQDDLRVPLEHGKRLREAMQKAGNEPEWVVYPGEGHSWRLPQTRTDFARRMERFLAEHLKP